MLMTTTVARIPRDLGNACNLAAGDLSTSAARGTSFALGGAPQIEYTVFATVRNGGNISAYTIRVVESHDNGATWTGVPSLRRGTNATAVSHTFTPSPSGARDVLATAGPVGGALVALEVTGNGAGGSGDAVSATVTIVE